eukprot:TRINITY_DN6253_c0_g2_i1.p1 TRINITY_DN6253_c0_g2~~TRINITY_DN6253_c0_g2_i1.p1  ORF type:complete len:403 (-),score=26.16 TRINITY_DN6253_c0_g2_i1:355-1422(-)
MEPVVVASFPTLKYSQGVFASRDDALCTVCLGEYEDKEILRLLPRCGHAFHLDCIDAWLRQHTTCPICRISLRTRDGRFMPSPLICRAAMSRFSPGALPDSMFEQQQQQQAQWPEGRQSGGLSPDRDSDTERASPYGVTRWRSNEAAEILWHMSRRQYPMDLERILRAEEDFFRTGRGEGTRISTEDGPMSGEVYFLGQRREIRFPRSGKWSVWLWRRWERGEPGSSPLNAEPSSEWASSSSASPPVTVFSPSAFNLRHNSAFADDGPAAAQTTGASPDHFVIPVAQVVAAAPVSCPVLSPGVEDVELRPPIDQEISEVAPTLSHRSTADSSTGLQHSAPMGVGSGKENAETLGR